jgi:hypothetical protein
MTILTRIQQILEEKEQISSLITATPDIPYDRILLYLGRDANKNEEALEITAASQSFLPSDSENESYELIQFQYVLPCEVSAATTLKVSSSLHFINRLLHCPGFELEELSDQILYRYTWFIKENTLDPNLLIQVLGNIQLCIEMFSPFIQDIAAGRYTLEDILEKVIQLGKHPHPKKRKK